MTRAYIRLIPDAYERKVLGIRGPGEPPGTMYSPAQFAAFVGTMTFSEMVSPRGRFKSRRVLEAMLAGPDDQGAAIAAAVGFLIDQGDLVRQSDGSLYFEGWDELQEGRDPSVNERMARYRDRKRGSPEQSTSGASPATRNSIVTGAGVTAESRPPLTANGQRRTKKNDVEPIDGAEPEADALTWLARHGCYVKPGNGYHQHLVLAVERHGVNAVVGMLDRLAAAGTVQGDVKGYVFGAKDALDQQTRPGPGDVAKAGREAEAAKASQRATEATQKDLAALTSIEAPGKAFSELVDPNVAFGGRQ